MKLANKITPEIFRCLKEELKQEKRCDGNSSWINELNKVIASIEKGEIDQQVINLIEERAGYCKTTSIYLERDNKDNTDFLKRFFNLNNIFNSLKEIYVPDYSSITSRKTA